MAARRAEPAVAPSLPPERAHTAIKRQLEALNGLRGQNYAEAEHQEQEWQQLTESVIERSFGKPSTNLSHFYRARSAGDYAIVPYGYGIDHGANQRNFETRINSLSSFLRASLSELELFMPEREIKGQYDAGDEYDFYRDIKGILSLAKDDLMIVDPYLSSEVFDVYADGINKSIPLRILTNNPPSNVIAVAHKYAAAGQIALRTSTTIHDRLIFIDDRVWFIGQSLKDAAKKKPTYVVEQESALVRPPYETIWNSAAVVI